jgi:hypothetical protein
MPRSPIDGAGEYMPKGVADRERTKSDQAEQQRILSQSKLDLKTAKRTLYQEEEVKRQADIKAAEDQWRRDRAADQARLKAQREADAELKRGQRLEQLEIKKAAATAKQELERRELAYSVRCGHSRSVCVPTLTLLPSIHATTCMAKSRGNRPICSASSARISAETIQKPQRPSLSCV